MSSSCWKEIRNTNVETTLDEKTEGAIKKLITIDAWRTDDDNEGGEVIAFVVLTLRGDVCVIYVNNVARTDFYAQGVIQEARKEILENSLFQ